jgi:long-chain fatty acid transport protein
MTVGIDHRRRTSRLLRPLLPLLLSLAIAHNASAQNTEDQNFFDFSLPGARSRGIGGAFVAVADDATSVYSNPAGLTQLFRPEVSIEGRGWFATSRAVDSGHAYGPPTGIGIDTIDGPVDRDFKDDFAGLSFLSLVYPGDGWAVGVFRHQLAKYRMDREITGFFFDCRGGYRNGADPSMSMAPFCEPQSVHRGVDREFPKQQSYSLDISSIGSAFAYNFTDTLSAGVSVQYFTFSLDATNKVFSARDGLWYETPQFIEPDNIEGITRQTGDDHGWGANGGILWKAPRRWTVGASVRLGPRFEYRSTLTAGPRYPPERNKDESGNPFRVPDTYSLGVAHWVSDLWQVSFEYDRVNYHQLIDDFRDTVFEPGNAESAVVAARVRLNNANQLRIGVERLFLFSGSRVLALRGGAWYDPNHQIYYDVDEETGYPLPRWSLLNRKRDGSPHVSVGVGFTTSRHFQLDAAVDLSDLMNTLAVSTVWRF